MTGPKERELMEEINRLKKALENEKKNLYVTLDSIVDGVYTTDADRKVTFWNKGAERITGYKAEDIKGKPCRDLLGHVDESGVSLCETACPLSETMKSNDPVYGKNVYSMTAWRRTIPVSVSCAPIIDTDGKVIGAVEVFRDISEQKKLEKQKADFYAMVSHDLRSPLMVIMGYSELLMEMGPEKAAGQMDEFLRAIHESGERLVSMIEDFLNLSKLQSGNLRLDLKPASLEELLGRLHRYFLPLAVQKGVRLDYRPAEDLPEVEFDERLIERAVSNLITNALKFTPEGGTVSLHPGRCAGGSVDIAVSDDGPGIQADDLDRVFDMYYRSKDTKSQAGYGLGLAIVKAISDAHGGRVSVKSEHGKGSTFTITLPCRPTQKTGAER